MRKCAVCGSEFEKYVPIEKKYLELPQKYGRIRETRSEFLNREEYSCPYCYAVDRDRMIVTFMRLLRACTGCEVDILEIAPSGALQRYLSCDWGKCNLHTADLLAGGVEYNVDIQDMKEFADDTFDLIVCSHVLEHVRDDRKAMRELCRVLDKKGLGIILVPLDLNQGFTDEEWGLSEAENWKRFGQGDHVRAYNKNEYVSRLRECGFGVHELGNDFFAPELFEENAWTDTSTLYLVYKSEILYGNKEAIFERFARAHENAEIMREYGAVDGQCEYWIDVCAIEDRTLKMWGWVFIKDVQSRHTKFKLYLKGEGKEYVIGMYPRKREDIQEHFGNNETDYTFSGIDLIMSVANFARGAYNVYILLSNGTRRYLINVKKELVID